MSLRDIVILLLILWAIAFFVPGGRPYRTYTGPLGILLVVLLILALAKVL